MPLWLLLVLVVGGIAGIAALLQLLGYSRSLHFIDAEAARAAWLRHFPDEPPTAVHLCRDGGAALVETAAGPGLIWAMGADSTAHMLTGVDLTETADGLYINLHDFAAPGLNVRLDPAERDTWRAIIPTPATGQGQTT